MLKPLRVGGHDPVLDAVVDHLDEVSGAVGAAMQITQFGGAVELLAARRARQVPLPGASVEKIGSRCFTTFSSPPIIMQ